MKTLDLDIDRVLAPASAERRALLDQAFGHADAHMERLPWRSPSPALSQAEIRGRLARFDFDRAEPLAEVVAETAQLLDAATTHCGHPRYLGLFNPTVSWPGVVGEFMAAAYNPNLACWTHAPAAVEIEAHLISAFGRLVGWPAEAACGHFTTGGAEANATALILALTRACPDYAEQGLAAFARPPVIYASGEAHLAWLKIAHQCGIGREAVRLVAPDERGGMDLVRLEALITCDRAAGHEPVLVIGTAGTTGAGLIDPLDRLAELAARESVYLHVDAAWGGAALFSPRLRGALAGMEKADSVTLDAHKWLSVPMGAGMLLCRDNELLGRAFRISASYMPQGASELDYYSHSVQWSRRFAGLKLFLTLAAMGRQGYAAMVERQAALGDRLRRRLAQRGWTVRNQTPLPVVCFDRQGLDCDRIAQDVTTSGIAWLSTVKLQGSTVLRACISSHRTREEDLELVLEALEAAAAHQRGDRGPRARRRSAA